MYSQRTLKSGDFQRCSPQLRPYPSKYISTASSPKLQPWLQTSLDYSAYNDPQTVPLDELEPFPDFVDIWDHWEEDDDDFGVQDAYMQHCIVHCNQRVCRWNTQHTKSAEGKEWKCTRRCESRKSNLPAVPAFGKDSLDKLTRKAVEVADRAYEKMNGQEMLTIDLQSALAIVERLNNIGILDFKFHLIGSPRFTASTLLHGRDYVRAAMDANSFIKKLSAYFSTSLTLLPGQTRPISICDLEEEMQKCMRLEVLWWICRWCLPSSLEEKKIFVLVIRRVNSGRHDEGIKVIFRRMEEVVREVISILAWWHREQCKFRAEADPK